MMEAGVVIDNNGEPIHWHTPNDRSSGHIPDSRPLWIIFKENRDRMVGFAHSHPGGGVPGPSWTDITTFEANESGLKKRLKWWIVSSEATVVAEWVGPDKFDYEVTPVEDEPSWVPGLRAASAL
jgi:hypothetical protein